MENIENISYYLINESINLAEMTKNDAYYLDFNKLVYLLMFAQESFLKKNHTSLLKYEFFNTQNGLTFVNDSAENKWEEMNSLMLKLLPFEKNIDYDPKYISKAFDVEIASDVKMLLKDILLKCGYYNAGELKNIVNKIYSYKEKFSMGYYIRNEELENLEQILLNMDEEKVTKLS